MKNISFNNDKCVSVDEKNEIVFTYLCPSLGVLGLVLNLICFFVFSSAEFKELFYKYLKMESFSILVDLFVTSLKPIYYCRTCQVSKSNFSQIFFIYFAVYLASILELTAIINRNISALTCYLFLKNDNFSKLKLFCEYFCYKLVFIFIFLISGVLFCYQTFAYEIVKCFAYDDSTESYLEFYIVVKTKFFYSEYKSILEIFAIVFRDGINLIILIILNILIFNQFRTSLSKKRNLYKKEMVRFLSKILYLDLKYIKRMIKV